MKKTYIYTALISFLFFVSGFSQTKKIENANRKYERFAYIDAQKIFLKVAQKGYKDKEIFEKLGNSYYFNADYDNANIWYEKLLLEYSDKVEAEYYFRYAQSLKSSEKYEESDKMMDKFFSLKGEDIRVRNYKNQPDYLKEIKSQFGKYKVEEIDQNSEYSDFGPTYYGKELVFASSRDTGFIAGRVHQWTGKPFLDLFKGKRSKNDNSIVDLKKFSKRLNTKFHESTPTFTKDLKTVYFTRNNYNGGVYKSDKNGTNRLKIYKSSIDKNGRWSKAKSIKINSDQYSVAHPALSADNSKMYFSSDMPGGFGMADLYEVSIDKDGTFGKPVNLGNIINTEGSESFPFVSESGDLYFASNGQIGLGGLDIYVAKKDTNGNIKTVVNLGEPINTPKDDFTFIVDEKTKTGYFSSNRDGGSGSDDIYKFIQEDPEPVCEVVVNGVVTDKDSGEILPGALVSIYNTNNELVNSMKVGAEANYSFVVECQSGYFLRASKELYNPSEKLIKTPIVSKTMSVPLKLEKTIKKALVGQDLGKILNLNPIYFDFDKYNIRYDASVELAKVIEVMKEYPTMKIDVRSHTDSRGNDEYNRILSSNRNKSTIDYIIAKGAIDSSRLTGKGYGESQLVNKCINGASCSEEEHQLNRRSEFIIVEY